MCYGLYTIRNHILVAKARSVWHMDFPSSCSPRARPPARRKKPPASSRATAALGLVAAHHAVRREDMSTEICNLRGTRLSRDNHNLLDPGTR
jgi:hypothetical protein